MSLADVETFIGLQYAKEIYGKGHPVAFLWSKRYGILIFYENMSRDYFLKILKYLWFDNKPESKVDFVLASLQRLDKYLNTLLINVQRRIRVNFY